MKHLRRSGGSIAFPLMEILIAKPASIQITVKLLEKSVLAILNELMVLRAALAYLWNYSNLTFIIVISLIMRQEV
jgi:hypothetical protein